MFNAISIAGTGLQSYHTWLDVLADNIANVNDSVRPDQSVFRTHYVEAQEIGGGPDGTGTGQGVRVAQITEDRQNGELVQDPGNPLADKDGYVRRADVDLSQQMGDLIMAQRAFQANANTIDRAKDAYQAALDIGRGI